MSPRIARISPKRWAATDDRFPRVVGYGDSPEDALRALEEKLPQRAPLVPAAPSLPLAPAHGLVARDLHDRRDEAERRERSEDAMDRALLVGRIEANRRRH